MRLRRTHSLRFVVAFALASVVPATTSAAELVWQVGLGAGWIFGRGFTVGPVVTEASHLVSGRPFGSWDSALVGGFALAGDVTFPAQGPPTFRVHLGPEVAAIYPCPVLLAPLSAGLTLAYMRGSRPRLGGTASVSLLISRHAAPTYSEPAPSPTWLLGPKVRVMIADPHAPEVELGGEVRVFMVPGGDGGLGYCGGD